MAVNSLKAILFIAGGAVVAVSAAYLAGVADYFAPEKPAQLVASPAPESAMKPAEAARPAGDQMAAIDTPPQAGAEAASNLVVPSFDLVRVEPDGSLVIAGHAAPGAHVEVVTGSSVIGAETAADNGDFAVVLEEPLKPGDYTIVLRATSPENVVATSEETAIVSVPDNAAGQVLALVEKPGAPSRLITVPEPEIAGGKQDRPAASGQPSMAAEGQGGASSQTMSSAQPAMQPGAAAARQEPVQQQAAAGQQPAQGQQAAEQQSEAGGPAAAAEPRQEQTAAAPAGEKSAQATSAPEQEPAQAAAPSSQPQQQMAAAAPEAKPQPALAAEKPRISVEAVEIEGRRVFVAGRTEPGARVRVYANEILLGDAKASPGGQFLVEAERDLPVGDYIVRADLLGPRAEVLARAAVPFEREPGETIAAVASDEPAAEEPQAEAAAEAEPAGQKPATGQVAAEESALATQQSEASAEAKPAETSAGGQMAAAGEAKPEAATDGVTREQPAMAAGSPSQPAASEATAQQPAKAASAEQEAGTAAAADAQEITAPKLKSVAGAVIIRRGDTLWRISRRVYGRGVRYTTIYLANQDQIEDPDRIWPGQVFSVPGKTGAGEEADMSAVADRMVPVE